MSLALLSQDQHPADMLRDISAVLCFLQEGVHGNLELAEQGAHGLTLILRAVQNTVDLAAERLE